MLLECSTTPPLVLTGAVSGTIRGERAGHVEHRQPTRAAQGYYSLLRACYAMSGTGLGCAAISPGTCYDVFGTDLLGLPV
eukprot:1423607-Rhodomonas_salina.1